MIRVLGPCSPKQASHVSSSSHRPGEAIHARSLQAPPSNDRRSLYSLKTPIPSHGAVLVYSALPANALVPQYPYLPQPRPRVPTRPPAASIPKRALSIHRNLRPKSDPELRKEEPPSHLDVQHLRIVLCFQSTIATLLFLLFVCVPLAMITIGTLNLSNCKLSQGIPLCLTIAGCAYFLIPLLSVALDWNAQNFYCPTVISMLGLVAAGASTAGAIFVYSSAWPSAKRDDPNYCNPVVYYFSFAIWTFYIVFVPVLIVVTLAVFRKYGGGKAHARSAHP